MTQALDWKLRRVAAGMRQLDVALRTGITMTRYSWLERGARPTDLEVRLIEQQLPALPTSPRERELAAVGA